VANVSLWQTKDQVASITIHQLASQMNRIALGTLTMYFIAFAFVQSGYSQMSAEKVLESYVKKTGGMMRYQATNHWRIEAEASLLPVHSKVNIEMTCDSKNRYFGKATINLPNANTHLIETGSDAQIYWEKIDDQEHQLVSAKKGAEKGKDIFDLKKYTAPKTRFRSIKNHGVTEIDGESCNELHLVKHDGVLIKEFYSVDSGLLIKSKWSDDSSGKLEEIERTFSDYQETKSGIFLPMKTTDFRAGEKNIQMKVTSLKTNFKIEKNFFEVPPEVNDLVKKKAKK